MASETCTHDLLGRGVALGQGAPSPPPPRLPSLLYICTRGIVLRSLTFSKFVRVRREPFAIRATHRLLCGERKARRGGSVDCNEQNCCSAADGESPPCALKWAKMLICARFRAFCSLLPRQAGRFRAEQVPHGLRRLRRGREELYCAFQLGEGRDGRDVSYLVSTNTDVYSRDTCMVSTYIRV